MESEREPTGSLETFPTRSTDRPFSHDRRVRRIGRTRLPLTLTHRPWATLYRFPDGRLLWSVRLWEVDGPVRRLFPTGMLLAYARLNRLGFLEAELDRLTRAAGGARGA